MNGPVDQPGVLRPRSLSQALTALAGFSDPPDASRHPEAIVLAGGTDLYPAKPGGALGARVIDLSAIAELSGVRPVSPDGQSAIRIGALTRWADLRDRRFDVLAGPAYDALAIAAAGIGGRQIQSRATIAGNLCHASPAADGIPVLLALGARVLLRDANGSRELPLTQFVTGPRRTALRAGELLEAVLIPVEPDPGLATHSTFFKLGQRRYLVISVAMIAVSLSWSGQGDPTLTGCRIAVGACGPVATRLTALEQQLTGITASQLARFTREPLEATALASLSPISDVRASADYRREAVDLMIRRALKAMADRPGRPIQVSPDPVRIDHD